MILYHYTCDHGRAGLGDEGTLLSTRDLVDADRLRRLPLWAQINAGFVWLTDLETPVRLALGLTSDSLGCDRTLHRYRVVDPSVAAHYPDVSRELPRGIRDLAFYRGAMPMHWWLAYPPVQVVYDPVGGAS